MSPALSCYQVFVNDDNLVCFSKIYIPWTEIKQVVGIISTEQPYNDYRHLELSTKHCIFL